MICQRYVLTSEAVRMQAFAMARSLPVDGSKMMILTDYVKPSSYEQQKRMFGYVVGEIAQQAWYQGRQMSVEQWHFVLKTMFLPEQFTEGETKSDYIKWLELPDGTRHMVGSTTNLTTKGHGNYVMACEAFAAQDLGVRFSSERDVF